MTRRHFLATLAAAYVTVALPIATTPPPPTVDQLSAGRRYQHNCTRWVRTKYRPATN